MRRKLAIVVALLAASPTIASDKVEMASPASWVKPIEIPADDGTSADAAVKILLQDQQVDFERDGTTTYYELAMRVQTPQGLAAGNISLPWNPETDTMTVHKVHIIRAGKIIDVLANQSFTILRRETNLENAVLDGVLTANVQPQGLQVGDIINFSASIKRADPAVAGHGEQLLAENAVAPVERTRIAARWPDGMPIRWHETDDLPALTVRHAGGFTSAELTTDSIKPAVLPKGAPQRFTIVRQAAFTDFANWSAEAALVGPLFTKASFLPPQGALQQEVARIAALSPDPKRRAEAALALVQNQVRYVYFGINDGGLTPAPAETTWSRRFGDCKGKTVLLLALLHGLGIDAEPVLVSAAAGDGLDMRLPMIGLFDHVLVRTNIGGKTYWLDGTRTGDNHLDNIDVPAFHWGLPLAARDAALVPIMPPPLTRPAAATTVKLDASAGIDKPAPAHAELVYRGDAAILVNLRLANLTADDRDRSLREFWRQQYAFIDAKTVAASYDAVANEEHLVLDGTAKMDWSAGGYETDGTLIGYTADFSRDAGPHADAPFAVNYPMFTSDRETIVLPNAGRGFTLDDTDLDRTIAGVSYHRRGGITDGVVSVDREVRSIAAEFPASDAPAAQEALRVLNRTLIDVHPPTADTASPAATGTAPTTAQAWIERGKQLAGQRKPDDAATAFGKAIALDPRSVEATVDLGAMKLARNQPDLAIADLNKALAIDPKSAPAMAERGNAQLEKNRPDLAMADFQAAITIDPLQAEALAGRGFVESEKGDASAALIDLTMALQGEPSNGRAYFARASILRGMGFSERALADADAAVKLWPGNPEIYVLRANLYKKLGKPDQSLAQAAAAVAAAPDNDYAHVVAGVIDASFDHSEDAMREFGKALTIRPSEAAYLNRADAWPRDDLVHRAADIEAARKLAPDSVFVAREQVALAEQKKDYATAIAALTVLLEKKPDDPDWLNYRGIDYARAGQTDRAAQDFAAARKLATDAAELNDLCYEKARAGEALAMALGECDAALAKNPKDAAILDSRGFVLLRLQRYNEAIRAYDEALAIDPALAVSLYGRSLANQHVGRADKSITDKAAAIAIKPGVAKTFAAMGVTS